MQLSNCYLLKMSFQVMETKNMLYLVSEYAPNGEIFGEWNPNYVCLIVVSCLLSSFVPYHFSMYIWQSHCCIFLSLQYNNYNFIPCPGSLVLPRGRTISRVRDLVKMRS